MENPDSVAMPAQEPVVAADFGPAGFWIRAGAYVIDGLLITLAQAAVMLLLPAAGLPELLARLLSAIIAIGYFVAMPPMCQGQTVGKMAAGIAIIRIDGSPLTYLRCLGRWAGYLLSGLLLSLGFVMAAFTKQKRALHDYVAGTRVVYIHGVGRVRKTLIILTGILLPLLILAAIALPLLLANRPDPRRDAEVLGNVSALRAAQAQYAAQNAGHPPLELSALAPRFLPALPPLQVGDHPLSADVQDYNASVCAGAAVDPAKLLDTGRWGYVSDPTALCRGAIFVDCSHKDSQQKSYVSY